MNPLFTLFLAIFLFFTPQTIKADWGKTGHRATGEIASQYLSKKAQKAIDQLLNGQSLALVSIYADEIKSDAAYRKYGPWHYVNYPFGTDYMSGPKSESGDIITAIQKSISVLKDKSSTKEDKAFYLKLLVHFLGDLHMPLHVGIAEDRGANRFQVQWFDQGTNLHRVWDENLLDYYDMSYTELVTNASNLSEAQLEIVQKGTPLDWMRESRTLCEDIYENTKVGANLKYEYAYRYMDTVRSQLQKGGIRLAVLLNDIFG